MLPTARHRAGTGHGRKPQDGAAPPRQDESLDGGAHPPLQALHRGLPRAGGAGLRRGRGAERRVRRLSRFRRHQSALSLQDQGAELPPSRRHGLPLPRPYARRRVGRARLHRHRVWGDRSVRNSKVATATLVIAAVTMLSLAAAKAQGPGQGGQPPTPPPASPAAKPEAAAPSPSQSEGTKPKASEPAKPAEPAPSS